MKASNIAAGILCLLIVGAVCNGQVNCENSSNCVSWVNCVQSQTSNSCSLAYSSVPYVIHQASSGVGGTFTKPIGSNGIQVSMTGRPNCSTGNVPCLTISGVSSG